MRTQVRKWGNSLAVRIPGDVARESGVAEGSEVYLVAKRGRIIVTPTRPQASLPELLRAITEDNLPDEGWPDAPDGSPRGREIW
jgi:antitoxin MazE